MARKESKVKQLTDAGEEIVARCHVRLARVAPRKMKMVADLVRGKTVAEALEILDFTHKPSAAPYVKKAIESALKNAERLLGPQNQLADPVMLRIGEIRVETGPILYRRSYAPRGRPVPIRVRRSHLHLYLTPVAQA